MAGASGAARRETDGGQDDRPAWRTATPVSELTVLIERAVRIASQTHRRPAGDMPASATPLVSLHDPDARPIAKGRINKPVEFGYRTQVVVNEDGIVVDHNVEQGNPADAVQSPALARIAHRTGKTPRQVTADRGYGEAAVEDELRQLGVKPLPYLAKARPTQPGVSMSHRIGPSFRASSR